MHSVGKSHATVKQYRFVDPSGCAKCVKSFVFFEFIFIFAEPSAVNTRPAAVRDGADKTGHDGGTRRTHHYGPHGSR